MPELRENTLPPAFRVPITDTDKELDAYERLLTYRQNQTTTPYPWGAVLAIGFVLAMIGGAVSVVAAATSPHGGGLVTVLVFGAFWSGAWTLELFGRRRKRRAAQANKDAFRASLQQAAILVTSRGVFTRSVSIRSFYPCSAIKTASREDELILLWTRRESAVALPVRLLTPAQQNWLLEFYGKKKPAETVTAD
jgi:hypothetical protein